MLANELESTMVEVNGDLAKASVTLTYEDERMLAERRAECLAAVERVEFGTPAVVAIAQAIKSSPYLTQENAAATLAHLQDAFYELRDELPVDVPDAEIVEALHRCLDELGDASEVAAMPADELMSYSEEYARMQDLERGAACRIVDDEGRAYTFDPAEWDYDETAPGWDGERWADDGDD